MQSFNHVAGGFAFAGIFASFADVNIFERFDTMAVVWVAAVLPDIDHTKSLIGKTFYPLARWLQRNYGHRTITHSIFFFLAVVILSKAVDNLFHLQYTLPIALALGSHLIFDMCTKQGIPIFYPFSRRPAVLPANPKLRLSANDFRSEAILFGIFCCLNVFSYPLMASGFWSRYNKSFATWDHLGREKLRKPGDYQARFLDSRLDTIQGVLVEQTASELVIWRKRVGGESGFARYDLSQSKLIEFTRLASHHQLRTINLVNVSADSLNTYLQLPIVRLTVQSEQELYYFEGPILKRGKELTADYPNAARFQQQPIDNAQTLLELQQLDIEHRAQQQAYDQRMNELKQLHIDLHNQTKLMNLSDYEEGKRRKKMWAIIDEIKAFEKPEPVNIELYKVRKASLEHKLQETAHVNATLSVWELQSQK